MQAHKLHLPLHPRRCTSSSSTADPSSVVVSSLLVEPSSRSLALMLSDSSVLLYPPFPLPLPLPPPPPPSSIPAPTAIPPKSTSVCFLRLQPRPDSGSGRVLFLSAASRAAAVLLRAWILSGGGGNAGERFAPARLSYKQDRLRPGITLDVRHGFSVTLAASVNVFVLHSPAAGRIWVYAARLVGEAGDEEPAVEVFKCASIECTLPIFSIQLSSGFLLLGEVGGVRVFPLRPLVKGRAGTRKNSRQSRREDRKQDLNGEPCSCRGRRLPNGLVAEVAARKNAVSWASGAQADSAGCLCNSKGSRSVEGEANVASDAPCGGKNGTERACVGAAFHAAKLRAVKLRQNSGDLSSYFVVIDSPIRTLSSFPIKAISIHALSQKGFLILDSTGNLHLLRMCNPILASKTTVNTSESPKDACLVSLDYTMKVQMLAILPDLSTRTQIVWISDAFHAVHIIPLTDVIENDKDMSEKKLAQVSAIQAIFTSERIQDIAPLTANTVMILGQGRLFHDIVGI